MEACSAIAESRISSSLDDFLKEALTESIKKSEKLAVAEPKLGMYYSQNDSTLLRPLSIRVFIIYVCFAYPMSNSYTYIYRMNLHRKCNK